MKNLIRQYFHENDLDFSPLTGITEEISLLLEKALSELEANFLREQAEKNKKNKLSDRGPQGPALVQKQLFQYNSVEVMLG